MFISNNRPSITKMIVGHTRLKHQLNKNLKSIFASPSKSNDEKEKEKKRKAIAKRFALDANIKTSIEDNLNTQI